MVAQACILATWEVEIGRTVVQDQPCQKNSRVLRSQPMAVCGWVCLSPQLLRDAHIGE
jgi:hypothetical protein